MAMGPGLDVPRARIVSLSGVPASDLVETKARDRTARVNSRSESDTAASNPEQSSADQPGRSAIGFAARGVDTASTMMLAEEMDHPSATNISLAIGSCSWIDGKIRR